MGPIREEALDLTVADILTSDLKGNRGRIKELLPAFVPQILSIQPSVKGAEDSFIWRTTNLAFTPLNRVTLLLMYLHKTHCQYHKMSSVGLRSFGHRSPHQK